MIKNYKLISFLIFIGQRIFFVRGSLKRFLNAYIHKLVNSHIEDKKYDIETSFFQSNSEGEIVDCVQSSNQTSDGLIINAAGFSHTSVALLDALLAIEIPKIEIHLTNLFKREDFRHHSFISRGVNGVICGFGSNSYLLAVDGINKLI